ncbi:hypothetical protein E5161_15290 [Cohnella pontilimi]|uniref:Uncharacterized protein n=1 Tax=Cohnella pontilimi TaxID=2564100 RepID=A0A4U0F8R1_9BACL|nr:hypothetical protein [Cohnella pontilimi]TJY41067.1 hypothetical protein E5161_15290 [Cohnella pontilimi]
MKDSKPEWYGRLKKGPFVEAAFDAEMRQRVTERIYRISPQTRNRRLGLWAAAGVTAVLLICAVILLPSIRSHFHSPSASPGSVANPAGMTESFVRKNLHVGMTQDEVRRVFGQMYEAHAAARSFPSSHQEDPYDLNTWASVNIWRYDYNVQNGYQVNWGEESLDFDVAGMESGKIESQLIIVWEDNMVNRAIFKYKTWDGIATTQIGPGVDEPPPASAEARTEVLRAVGESSFGTFELRPVAGTSEKIQPLGAPSCLGLETDVNIAGDYELFFRDKNGALQSVYSLNGLEFIQHNEEPVAMRKFDFPDVELFLLIPRYTDCHGLEVYAFGVDKQSGKPSVFPFKTRDQHATVWTTSPVNLPVLENGSLIIEGGRGAGTDGAVRYTFKPDLGKRVLMLESQEQIP